MKERKRRDRRSHRFKRRTEKQFERLMFEKIQLESFLFASNFQTAVTENALKRKDSCFVLKQASGKMQNTLRGKIATLPCFFTEDLTLKKSLKSGCIKSCFLISHFIFLHLSFAFVCSLCKIPKFLLFIYFTCNLVLL